MIQFNGTGDEAHETFTIEQSYMGTFKQWKGNKLFEFCKTARKEYDTVVVACLIILKHHFGNDVVVQSDGYADEWQIGLNAVKDCLNYGSVPFERE